MSENNELFTSIFPPMLESKANHDMQDISSSVGRFRECIFAGTPLACARKCWSGENVKFGERKRKIWEGNRLFSDARSIERRRDLSVADRTRV